MSDTVDTENLSIRAKPKPVRRFNKNALLGASALAILLVGGVAAYALRDPAPTGAASATELCNTTNKPVSDRLAALPTSYGEVSTRLGPPLPGDLGAAMIANEAATETRENPFRFVPAEAATTGSNTYVASATSASEVRTSGLFFIEPPDRTRGGVAPLSSAATVNPFDQISTLIPSAPADYRSGGAELDDPNHQTRKEGFLGAEIDDAIYNPHRLQDPVSPYQVMAGTIIPASLVTGLNSDLPGQVIAQVTENVYDTPTGQHLLIPQGTRLIGRYDSVIAFGQSRALMVWTRIIMPDGSSLTIENLPGVDLAGYAGVEDRVDNHTWQLFQAAFLSSILSVGAELGRDSNDNEILQALRDGGQRTLNQAGQRIVNRQLNVQPTITVRPGWRLRVIVNKDLVLRPYGA
ncbi:MAG: TrbI/VirB10 family protein [Pseudomonadota bacterium]